MIRFAAFRALTRLEQTLFGLPFVVAGALLGCTHHVNGIALLWVVPAFMLARISGMSFNQLIDRNFDARNPRTQNRPIPSGKVSVSQARIIAWTSLVLFVVVCFQINALTAVLSICAAFLLYLYSYMKRIHPSCHFVLGAIHFLGPIMAYSAVTGSCSPQILFLGGAAACLLIGTDVAYAIQDYAFDCQQGLFSIPSRFGIPHSLSISAIFHVLCVCLLLGVGLSAHFPILYYPLIPFVGGFLCYFHYLIRLYFLKGKNFKSLEFLFFICNVAVSSATLLFITVSILCAALL